ncbi:hypothetical protein FRC14_000131 [Serendipita sp. 396]|nr:hypothetical protein FRC14_000131 [Serendipita sp. 396]KAG8789125.1 hypothetical protein FRC15_011693 [Serendipita sp. 397]KAG8804183.1 hypothetical protein FRC16_000123 [Serendipita sp. 398]KAG8827183.1 hypothetical protein FRC19_005001 [Serendipita sp. 401]KAG8877282.1 hypothetical protein FRC20_011648 [Serendipita sp. 405]KAG9057558.1 hypothetical protein FS842_005770 [Serendipita sp. 407]
MRTTFIATIISSALLAAAAPLPSNPELSTTGTTELNKATHPAHKEHIEESPANASHELSHPRLETRVPRGRGEPSHGEQYLQHKEAERDHTSIANGHLSEAHYHDGRAAAYRPGARAGDIDHILKMHEHEHIADQHRDSAAYHDGRAQHHANEADYHLGMHNAGYRRSLDEPEAKQSHQTRANHDESRSNVSHEAPRSRIEKRVPKGRGEPSHGEQYLQHKEAERDHTSIANGHLSEAHYHDSRAAAYRPGARAGDIDHTLKMHEHEHLADQHRNSAAYHDGRAQHHANEADYHLGMHNAGYRRSLDELD